MKTKTNVFILHACSSTPKVIEITLNKATKCEKNALQWVQDVSLNIELYRSVNKIMKFVLYVHWNNIIVAHKTLIISAGPYFMHAFVQMTRVEWVRLQRMESWTSV